MEDHKHCEICGKVVTTEDRFCSEACVREHEDIVRMKKRNMTLWVVVLAVMAALWQAQRLGFL